MKNPFLVDKDEDMRPQCDSLEDQLARRLQEMEALTHVQGHIHILDTLALRCGLYGEFDSNDSRTVLRQLMGAAVFRAHEVQDRITRLQAKIDKGKPAPKVRKPRAPRSDRGTKRGPRAKAQPES